MASISSFWQTKSDASARLVDRADAVVPEADLVYDFDDAEGGTVTLSSTLELPFHADRLSRIQLSVTADDTWHRIDFYVEKGGRSLLTFPAASCLRGQTQHSKRT